MIPDSGLQLRPEYSAMDAAGDLTYRTGGDPH
jgi:hypothetical protein